MKKYMDKLNIKINKNLFVFLLIIVIVGITAGALFTAILSDNDKNLVVSYLNDFFTNISKNNLNYTNSFINALILTVGLALIIWILGISVIGFFIIIIVLFVKAFVLGFSLGSIIATYKFKGIIMGFIYIFPHHIINVLIFILISAFALIMSFKIINNLSAKKPVDFKNFMHKYIKVLIISVVILILTSLYEIYALPNVINFVIDILKW